MMLVDSDIKTFIENGKRDAQGQTAIFDGDAQKVSVIGYDLTAEYFYRDTSTLEECELLPGESAFVGSREIVAFDNVTVGKVSLRNSRIRMGLSLDAPVYLPGHKTRIFFRLTNVSNDKIVLRSGQSYASLCFEQLERSPDEPYTGTFQREFDFQHLADYKSQYTDQIKSIDGKLKNLEEMERSIYSNVILILTVFVAIFTILNVNISLAATENLARTYLIFNLSTIGAISALALLLVHLLDSAKKKLSKWLWVIPCICFLAVCILIFFLA